MISERVSRRHFFYGALLTAAIPAGGFGSTPSLRRLNFRSPNEKLSQWFDISAFRMQTFGTAGNEGRNQYFGPPQKRLDFSVFKSFPITEAVRLQFRAEFFNITNTPNFARPGTNISTWTSSDPATAKPTASGNFGKIIATSGNYTPHDIQFALKLLF